MEVASAERRRPADQAAFMLARLLTESGQLAPEQQLQQAGVSA